MANKLIGPGRLPLPENLADKNPSEILSTLQRFNISPDMKEVQQRATRAYARLGKIIESGIDPDEAMWAALEDQNVREMTQTLRQMAKAAIRDYRNTALQETGSNQFVWVTSGKGSCPSCSTRHGRVRTWAMWERLGLPGSSGLICETECNCQLLPAP